MRYHEIEECLINQETIDSFRKKLEDDQFACIAHHSKLFKTGIMNEPGQLKATLEELTGVYMDLATISGVLEEIIARREEAFFCRERAVYIANDDKFVVSVMEKESRNQVAHLKILLSEIKSNVEASGKGMSSCQSQMKLMTQEINLAH
jgi:hypothetical protein